MIAAHSFFIILIFIFISTTESLFESKIFTFICEIFFSASFSLNNSLLERSKKNRFDQSFIHESNDFQAATSHLIINVSSIKFSSSFNSNKHTFDFFSTFSLSNVFKRRERSFKNIKKIVFNNAKSSFTTFSEFFISSTEVFFKFRNRFRKTLNSSHATVFKFRKHSRKTFETIQKTKSNTSSRHQSKKVIFFHFVAPKSLKKQLRHRNNFRFNFKDIRSSTFFQS